MGRAYRIVEVIIMNKQRKILILYGYDRIFAHSLIRPGFSGAMDVNIMKSIFENNGYFVEVSTFSELDLTRNFKDWFVLYASSEEKGLFYKDYIEDVLLSINLSGGILLPEFKYFRAHHNKSFAEMLRFSFKSVELKTVSSRAFGNYKELYDISDKINYPAILKVSAGWASNGVKLVNDFKELIKMAKKINKLIYFDFWFSIFMFNSVMVRLKNAVKFIIGRQTSKYSPLYSNKFIIQNYIKNLMGDFKILVFMDKYFVLHRENREKGFTASGSGKSSFPADLDKIKDILDFAMLTHEELNTPISSLDIGRNEDGCHLLEFQCLFFGPYTLQQSPCYFMKEKNKWIKISNSSNLESEYCRAIDMYIKHFLSHLTEMS